MGRKIRSKKAPFANLATILLERATAKMLTLKYPVLSIAEKEKRRREDLYQPLHIKKAEKRGGTEFYTHLKLICKYLDTQFTQDIEVKRWGKCAIREGVTLRSRMSELKGQASRSSRYFEANRGIGAKRPTFGEALAFYSVPEYDLFLVVYHAVVDKFGVVLLCFVSDWSGFARFTCELPSGLFPLISRTSLVFNVLCHVLYHVSCHVLIALVLRPSVMFHELLILVSLY
jgi:hypothetical protein